VLPGGISLISKKRNVKQARPGQEFALWIVYLIPGAVFPPLRTLARSTGVEIMWPKHPSKSKHTSPLVATVPVVFLLATMAAAAQPVLDFKRIATWGGDVDLYLSTGCNGQPAYFTDKRYFTVRENGVERTDFEIWCPDFPGRCTISVALVLDASAGMAGVGNTAAKAAGNAFVDMMDGISDEAAVLYFNSTTAIGQRMTSYLDLLHPAVNALPASGGAALWDALLVSIQTLSADGVNPCKAIIVCTNGRDNASAHTAQDVLLAAKALKYRIFAIGVGDGIRSEEVKALADSTGGRYYGNPSPSQLVAVYQEISAYTPTGYQECIIWYPLRCMDDSVRTVELSLANFCNGSVTKTLQYISPIAKPAPVVTRSVNTLSTRRAFHLQWYRNGVLIPGAGDSLLKVTAPGSYTVLVTNEYGCSGVSAPYEVLVLPVAAVPVAAAFSLDVFPDPVRDYITVVMNGTDRTDGKRVVISILDAAGRAVVADCEVDTRSGNPMTISLKEQPSGLYFVTGTSGGVTVVRKFVKVE
jgi:Mg-chelatase subunit ChlD